MTDAVASRPKSGTKKSTVQIHDFDSDEIIKALQAWQAQAETIDPKALLKALRAYRNGNFSVRLPEYQIGIAGEISRAFNESIELNQLLLKEFERVGKVVGREGKLSQRVTINEARGSWSEVVNAFNGTVDGLVGPISEIGRVIAAVGKGDLTETMPMELEGRPLRGEFLRVAKITNQMISLLNNFSNEVSRVAFEVGTEGSLGGQAKIKGLAGAWSELTNNVNRMADNLTSQVRNIAQVTAAVASGDLNQKITVDAKGEVLELKYTINNMVDQLQQFSSEVSRLAWEVGTDGILGGSAEVRNVSGVWQDLTNNVNSMAANLTSQVRNIAIVTTAVADGDLSQKITIDAKGEVLELKNTINTMVDQLSQFSSEVTRLAREVGTGGTLGGNAEVKDVSGVWKDLTDNVNNMADNLTSQVRNIAIVAKAVANGDLEQKITVDARGEVLELKNTINTMVDQLSQFSSEVSRLAQDVGSDGILGGKAEVKNVSGVWQDLTNNVNGMADNLTNQVRNIAIVVTAVANGELNQKITVDARGEILLLKNTINSMVDQLNLFSSEVTRVAQQVGTEGKLGGRAEIKDVSGSWKDLTDNVNSMAGSLTNQVRDIATVTAAVANGNLDQKITVDAKGEVDDLKKIINTMVDRLSLFSSEVTRVAREVGTEGKLGGSAEVPGVSGVWKDLTDNVNGMADNLTSQVRNIATVASAVANGDLSQKIMVDAKGEIEDLKLTVNTMIDQLSQFATEVTRVAFEVGSEGILGGEAQVKNVAGVWDELTNNVNVLANNLTMQVRDIARVVKAIEQGDLEQKITVEVKGEVLELKDTINKMSNTLSVFATQVTNVALEVGIEGKLGGQADVPYAAGIWNDLTNNVNQLADNLTQQIRAISTVVTGVTGGDLTGQINIEARGEVDVLKAGINQMVTTLRETSEINQQQGWLKTNLAEFSRLMQGKKDLQSLAETVITDLCPLVKAQHGVFYILDSGTDDSPKEAELMLIASYAFSERKSVANTFEIGQGLVGQCGLEKKRILVHNVPQDYIKIGSGLGQLTPLYVVVVPVLFEGTLIGVIELGSFEVFTENELSFLDQLMVNLGVVANSVKASVRTENLLQESQTLTEELTTQQEELKTSNVKLEQQAKTLQESELKLKNQQEELQQTNEELEEKSKVLADQKREVEVKNSEVEEAKAAVEEKAQQLVISSKYKSEFLANMSHELRTPLNSLMVLSDGLRKNLDKNLNKLQIEKMTTIHDSGIELLELINEILDLAKIEAGKMTIQIGDIFLQRIQDWSLRGFKQMAENKQLTLAVNLGKKLPKTLQSDEKRLQQVIKNFLSNAIKFTEAGGVTLDISIVDKGWDDRIDSLNNAASVIAFAVMDTGIGIAEDKHQVIFEAFQQADGTTSRKFGGTGLGLSISREIAHMLGGQISLQSIPGKGSTFTLFLPNTYTAAGQNIDTRPLSQALSPPMVETVKTSVPDTSLAASPVVMASSEVEDDRVDIQAEDRVVLIIEDDIKFAKVLLDKAREQGFKGVVATSGDTGLMCAQEYQPDGIILDIKLPIMNGWTVLDRIKHDPAIRHIPVQIASVDDVRQRSLKQGAISFLQKPLDDDRLQRIFSDLKAFQQESLKQLLVIEDNAAQRQAIADLIGNGDVKVTAVETAKEAIKKLKKQHFDCMVLDLMLPDMSGFDLIETIKKQPQFNSIPIVIYTGKELSQEEETRLNLVSETIIIKDARSPERLLDETALFLHRVESKLPESKREMLQQVHENDPALAGKKILIVDDDVRNIFTLTTVFEAHQCVTLYAESGQQALDSLNKNPEIDIILMDIMMPGMDGYETMREIRKMQQFVALPIIAVTAKAMKDDREKCIAAGASDYIVKPINTEQLLSLVRVWLYK